MDDLRGASLEVLWNASRGMKFFLIREITLIAIR